MADFLRNRQATNKKESPAKPAIPKIERIALAGGRTSNHEYLVWSKKHAYGMDEYKLFEQDAGRWIARMLRRGGCKDKIEYGFMGETCAGGVLCTRVVVRERVGDTTAGAICKKGKKT